MFEIICSDGVQFKYNGHFDVLKTMSSGQAFRWKESHTGIEVHSLDKHISLNQDSKQIHISCNSREFRSYWEHYFDLKRDYSRLGSFAGYDPFFKECLEYGKGIRLLKQDAWETIICFLLSQRSSIPRIKNMVERLCKTYGGGNIPSPEILSKLDADELGESIGCGYRSPYLVEAGSYYISNRKAFARLDKQPTAAQEAILLNMFGVGQKVADCVILFGLHNGKAFPVDVWIERIIDQKYNGILPAYRYGNLAGIVQQYMFYYAINHREEFE